MPSHWYGGQCVLSSRRVEDEVSDGRIKRPSSVEAGSTYTNIGQDRLLPLRSFKGRVSVILWTRASEDI